MQTSNAQQSFRSNDPAWVLLAELLLSDFLLDQDWRDEPAAGFLFQTLRELGVSHEAMENIARDLAEVARERLLRRKQGEMEFPGRIRVFCQKKMFADANSARVSRPCHTEQDKKQEQFIPDSEAGEIGGWGYFMIERGEDLPTDASVIPHSDIDLYLYRE